MQVGRLHSRTSRLRKSSLLSRLGPGKMSNNWVPERRITPRQVAWNPSLGPCPPWPCMAGHRFSGSSLTRSHKPMSPCSSRSRLFVLAHENIVCSRRSRALQPMRRFSNLNRTEAPAELFFEDYYYSHPYIMLFAHRYKPLQLNVRHKNVPRMRSQKVHSQATVIINPT